MHPPGLVSFFAMFLRPSFARPDFAAKLLASRFKLQMDPNSRLPDAGCTFLVQRPIQNMESEALKLKFASDALQTQIDKTE